MEIEDNIITSTPLISIIVPVFNVAPYLRQCLESIRLQTLDNIEVIMIDDGSTDESGKIVDEYAADERFKAIHTENRGLSAARNRGIEKARAEWIMFVDGDDWVEKSFCDYPLGVAIENEAEIVIFGAFQVSEKGKTKKMKYQKDPLQVFDRERAIDDGGVAAWNKLYKRSLFDDIRYPEGYVFEDMATTHKLIFKANRIVKLTERLYYHRYRKDSLSHLSDNLSDYLELSMLRYTELIQLNYPMEKAQSLLCKDMLRCCGRMQNKDSEEFQKAKKYLDSVRKTPVLFSKKEKTMLCVWRVSPILYRLLYRICQKLRA